MPSKTESNGSTHAIVNSEFGSDDSGFRRRLATMTAVRDYFSAMKSIADDLRDLEDRGILTGKDVSRTSDVVRNTFRQDHPVLEVDNSTPTLEDFCLNVNDEILAEKMEFIQKARQRAEGRQRKWEKEPA